MSTQSLRINRNVLAQFLPDHDAIKQFERLMDRAIFDSDDITEGTLNLFYTEARFNASLATKDTDDLTEGGVNLYFTDARVATQIASGIVTYGYESISSSSTVTKTKTNFTGSTAGQTITLPTVGTAGREIEVFNSSSVNVTIAGSSVLTELYPDESACFTDTGSDWIA